MSHRRHAVYSSLLAARRLTQREPLIMYMYMYMYMCVYIYIYIYTCMKLYYNYGYIMLSYVMLCHIILYYIVLYYIHDIHRGEPLV